MLNRPFYVLLDQRLGKGYVLIETLEGDKNVLLLLHFTVVKVRRKKSIHFSLHVTQEIKVLFYTPPQTRNQVLVIIKKEDFGSKFEFLEFLSMTVNQQRKNFIRLYIYIYIYEDH